MGILELPVLDILKLGLVGLCFLLCLLSFYLLYTEQRRDGNPRRMILRSIYVFMGVTLLFFIGNAVIEIYKSNIQNDLIHQENETLKNENEILKANEKLYKRSWTINGTFELDYYDGGRDVKFYTIPPTDINTYVLRPGVTGFSITNFKPVIIDDEALFPVFGFQSDVYCSTETVDINSEGFENHIVKLNTPVSFIKIPVDGDTDE